MTEIPAEYLLEIARQLSFIAALLGGFSATFLATLLLSHSESRVANVTLIGVTVSTCAFIVSVVALTMLIVGLNPSAPKTFVTPSGLLQARTIGTLSFMLGLYAILFSIGISGWVRSKKIGRATTGIALVAAGVATWCII